MESCMDEIRHWLTVPKKINLMQASARIHTTKVREVEEWNMQITGADLFVKALKEEQVRT